MRSHTIQFSRMSSDIADKFMPEGNYKKARNFRPNNLNTKGGFVVSNVRSNKKIDNLSLDQAVEYIGGCQDPKRNAIISFYRGSTINYITGYNTKTQQEYLIARWTKTNVSFVNRVDDAGVLDDYLFWVSDNKARKLNIVKAATDTTLDRYSSSDVLIDKFPPLMPPTGVALQDTSFIGNNIRNNTYQFAYAYEYEDGELSSYSPFSKSVLPQSTGNLDVVFPNNAIDVTVNTGTESVKKIWIVYRAGEDRDWSWVEKLDKEELGITGATYTYRFYNDKYIRGLVQADVVAITNNPFHYFGSQAISRDNFVMYGLVKDGLPKPTDISLSLTYNVLSSSSRVPSYKTGSIHEFGIVFSDENGRTDGVNAITSINIPFYTDPAIRSSILATNIPYVTISWEVSGTAPSWAKTFSIVYLGNKTIASFVDYTLSKIEDVGVYTYMSLEGLNLLKKSASVLDPRTPNSNLAPYTFTKGDRIRFRTSKSGVLLDATSNKYDYEILGYVSEVIDSAGNILYPETIYTDKFNWASASIDKKSVFEIYSPKKEFEDDIFYEIGEVYTCTQGTLDTTTGTLTQGDVYVFDRDMSSSEFGELIADERKGLENPYNYPVDFNKKNGRIGFTPMLNVLKPATGVQAQNYTENSPSAKFYHNTSGSTKQITITGEYDFTSESNDGYWFVIRRRTVSTTLQDYLIFEEPNHDGGLSVYHKGLINFTFNVLNDQFVSLYFDNRDNYSANLIFRTAPKITLSVKIQDYPVSSGIDFIESRDYSDYFSSDEHSKGRPYVEIPEEDLTAKNNIVYTGKYFADTNIDETNKIDPINVKYVPYSYGWINYMCVRGDTLKVFTENKEISFYLGKESYKNPDGSEGFIFSNSPIGSMRVYDSDFGVSNREAVLQTNNAIYFYDRKNATLVVSLENGQQDLGDASQKTYLREVTSRINNAITNNVFIGYNDKNKEVIVCFVIDGQQETIVFNEDTKSFTHFLDLQDSNSNAPEGMCHYGENLLVYLQGKPYLNEQGTGYNNFFGSAKQAYMECVFNPEPNATKILQTISHQGVGKYEVVIETDPSEEYPYGQYTKITKGRFVYLENRQSSDVPMNLKQKTGTISSLLYANGQPMRDRYATIKLTNNDTTEVRLDLLSINYENSGIN